AGDLPDRMPGMLAAMDEPTVDGINTYVVSEAARRAGLTVVLSGTGGDEVFLGYPHFRRSAELDHLRTFLGLLPRLGRRAFIGAGGRGSAAMGDGKWDRLRYLVRPSLDNVYRLVRGLFGPRQIQDLLGIGERELEACSEAWAIEGRRTGATLTALEAL